MNTALFTHHQIKVTGGSLHVVETGAEENPPILFIHGYPEDWSSFEKTMTLASEKAHVFAIDISGIGESHFAQPKADKISLAQTVQEFLTQRKLQKITLVGHDIGGMITYAFLKTYPNSLKQAVILDTAIPGVDPWDEVLRNPYIWHFGFHSIPKLPEILVKDNIQAYFDFFYQALSADPKRITSQKRKAYVKAYSKPSSLTAGFDLYRTFAQDAKENTETAKKIIETPLLYLRGDHGGGNIEDYLRGFRKNNIKNVTGKIIKDSGHFIADEQPEALWETISSFMQK